MLLKNYQSHTKPLPWHLFVKMRKNIKLWKISLKNSRFKEKNIKIDGQTITDILTVNGIRFSLEDGSWGL